MPPLCHLMYLQVNDTVVFKLLKRPRDSIIPTEVQPASDLEPASDQAADAKQQIKPTANAWASSKGHAESSKGQFESNKGQAEGSSTHNDSRSSKAQHRHRQDTMP